MIGRPAISTQAQAEPFAGERYSADAAGEDFGFVGTPQQVIAQVRHFIGLGIDYFIFDCGGFPQLNTLDMLIGEVLPAVRDCSPSRLPGS